MLVKSPDRESNYFTSQIFFVLEEGLVANLYEVFLKTVALGGPMNG